MQEESANLKSLLWACETLYSELIDDYSGQEKISKDALSLLEKISALSINCGLLDNIIVTRLKFLSVSYLTEHDAFMIDNLNVLIGELSAQLNNQ
ncbi:MAG: hypothetical protein WBH20_14800 [Oceanisphaera sp.]|uniref:hypothetical protein n=1 Tax=Oceanisphaera sp. TaxID=1929979 RepID=UPI003C782F75